MEEIQDKWDTRCDPGADKEGYISKNGQRLKVTITFANPIKVVSNSIPKDINIGDNLIILSKESNAPGQEEGNAARSSCSNIFCKVVQT